MAEIAPVIAAASDPIAEPIVVTLCDGSTTVVHHPDDPTDRSWDVALAWREEKVAREALEADLRVKRGAITRLQSDQLDRRNKARARYGGRSIIEDAFARWDRAVKTRNPRRHAKLTPERFDMAWDRMAHDDYPPAMIVAAAEGVGRCPHTIDGETHDDWRTAMSSGEAVERYAARCPRDVKLTILAAYPLPENWDQRRDVGAAPEPAADPDSLFADVQAVAS